MSTEPLHSPSDLLLVVILGSELDLGCLSNLYIFGIFTPTRETRIRRKHGRRGLPRVSYLQLG